jgi:ATP-dependent protease ClpP protease subunit
MNKIILAIALLFSLPTYAEDVVLTTTNTVTIRGEISGVSVTKAMAELAYQNIRRGRAPYKIYLVLDSPGGSIYAGDAFIQFAKTIRDLETVTIFSASMAAGIVQALPGRRLVTENGILMFHRASGSFEGQFEDGEVESQLRLWKAIVRAMEVKNSTRMGMSLEEYKQKSKDEYWLYGTENVTSKAADAQVDIKCSRALIEQTENVVVESFFGVSTIKFSACPLFRSPI